MCQNRKCGGGAGAFSELMLEPCIGFAADFSSPGKTLARNPSSPSLGAVNSLFLPSLGRSKPPPSPLHDIDHHHLPCATVRRRKNEQPPSPEEATRTSPALLTSLSRVSRATRTTGDLHRPLPSFVAVAVGGEGPASSSRNSVQPRKRESRLFRLGFTATAGGSHALTSPVLLGNAGDFTPSRMTGKSFYLDCLRVHVSISRTWCLVSPFSSSSHHLRSPPPAVGGGVLSIMY